MLFNQGKLAFAIDWTVQRLIPAMLYISSFHTTTHTDAEMTTSYHGSVGLVSVGFNIIAGSQCFINRRVLDVGSQSNRLDGEEEEERYSLRSI